jgi:hypothetical protein
MNITPHPIPKLDPQIDRFLRDHGVIEGVLGWIRENSQSFQGHHLTPTTRVSCLNRLLAPEEELMDCLGNLLTDLRRYENAVGLQVDLEPSANWAHPCWLGVVSVGGPNRQILVPRQFPFMETDESRLVPIA